jgi:excisionase family DNA binding protein
MATPVSSSETNNNASGPDFLTVKETAEYLRIPTPTVYYLAQRGQLPAVQIGGRWRIRKDLIDKDILKLDVKEPAPETNSGGVQLLIVDDDEMLTGIFAKAMVKEGHNTDVAYDGAQTREKLGKKKYDIVFLDLNLPDVPGETLFKEIQDKHPEMHVVVLTGCKDSDRLQAVLEIGPVTVLQKPFELQQLLRIIRMLCLHRG